MVVPHRSTVVRIDEERLLGCALAALDAERKAGQLEGPDDLQRAARRAAQTVLVPGLGRLGVSPDRAGAVFDDFFGLVLQRGTQALVHGAAESVVDLLKDEREQREGLEHRLYGRWRDGLNLLAGFRLMSLEAAETFHERHRPAEGDWSYNVLVRLHARACLVTAEVLTLLRAGLASGAHARWRSLHELAVVACFIGSPRGLVVT